ncbi:ribosome hibernation-promoting factor, HPF/YfiA family [Lacipirellula sp.]|uniref:ribosome hibernation-promoting factor, HPF/YfiA family n=1 Tax=Lacipirellula sp. TaxID=2691419 RepID=UPI003D0B4E55
MRTLPQPRAAAATRYPGRPQTVQISVSTRHGHLSEATQEKLRAKAEKLVRIFDRLMSIEIVVDLKDEAKPKVDLQVSAEHKHDFVAHEQGENLLGALESTIGKVEEQLRRYKERVQERHRNPEARRQEAPVAGDEGADDADE